MKKVKPGSVDTLMSIKKKERLADPYLIKCTKAVSANVAIIITERPVINTQNERNKFRARIITASQGKRLSVNYAPAENIFPEMKKGKVFAIISLGKPRKIYP